MKNDKVLTEEMIKNLENLICHITCNFCNDEICYECNRPARNIKKLDKILKGEFT